MSAPARSLQHAEHLAARSTLGTVSSADDIPEPTPARPWSPDDGARPTVTTWPTGNRPALSVWSAGRWRYAPIRARQDWVDGRTFYQVEVDLRGDTHVTTVLYEWPQPGLRVAHPPRDA